MRCGAPTSVRPSCSSRRGSTPIPASRTWIGDQGAGFDPSKIPDPTIDPIALIEGREKVGKRPGGFGIHLARRIMDSVAYNERGNEVLMEKRFTS